MLSAVCAFLILAAAACSNKNKTNETAAELETPAAKEPQTEDKALETSPADEPAIEEEDNDYFTDTPVGAYGTIKSIDAESGEIMIAAAVSGNDSSVDPEDIIYHTADGVPVIDAVSGLPVALQEIAEGSTVYVWSSEAMTLSLPAQTNLQALVVNIPQDTAAPQYIVVKGIEWSKDDVTLSFTDHSGRTWTADSETRISPYRTKQVVSLDDIKKGTRLFIWPSSDNDSFHTEKIIIAGD